MNKSLIFAVLKISGLTERHVMCIDKTPEIEKVDLITTLLTTTMKKLYFVGRK